jgi:hypothetical protein
MERGAEILAVDMLAAHRANEKPALVAEVLLFADRGFNAFAQIGWESVICHAGQSTPACEFPPSYDRATRYVLDMFSC